MDGRSEKHRVLIVDDSPDNIRVLMETLKGNYAIQVALDGEEALKAAMSETMPDIILLDIVMPGIDGYEVCRRLKQDPRTRTIPVLFVTGMSEVEDETKGLELGAVDYIAKPFSPPIIQARVRTHLALSQAYETVKREKEKSDRLLLNILPSRVAEELKQTGKTTPEYFKNVTVCFSDIVNFTEASARLSPSALIHELNDIFTQFDSFAEQNGCERIKTIGDAYLAVCGMPVPSADHAQNMIRMASEMIRYMARRNTTSSPTWQIRIGIHTGSVVGAVVGVKKYIYDVFGDTINTTSRMEENSEPMRVNVSEETYARTKDAFRFIERPPLEVKAKGLMRMYFLDLDGDAGWV